MSDVSGTASKSGGGLNILGIITIILGVLVLMAPFAVGSSILMLVGALVVVAGFVRIVWAFRAKDAEHRTMMFVVGALTLLAGIVMVASPDVTSGVITILLGIYFVVDGAAEIYGGFQLPSGQGRGWMLFGGVVSVILGILIWRQYPLTGAMAIGVLLGIKMILVGILMITVGSSLRIVGKSIEG